MSEAEEDEDWDFDEKLALEQLEALYSPDNYAEGESFCMEILEDLAPDFEPARLYLLLNLAALDCEEEALQMVDDLSAESLLEALRQLTFGAGTQTEELVYEDIIACAQARGLAPELEKFFATVEKPWPRTDVGANLSSWD